MTFLSHLLAAGGVMTLGLALHPFTTYPLSLAVLARLRPRPHRTAAPVHGTKVAVCICAYNEAAVIAARIDNLLQLRASVPDLEILVYVDAAWDGTTEIVRSYGDAIRSYVSSVRRGKSCGMNQLVAMTDAELIVFTDANVIFSLDALPHLLAPFADQTVGCVCGHLIYTSPSDASATALTGSLYWRIEERIKELESRTGSVMGADGSIYAIRRRLHRPPPEDLIDDMFVSLSVLCSGYRIVRAAEAKAYEEIVAVSAEEFRRKVRIACQAFNVHRVLRSALRSRSLLDRYMYVSHKIIRWMTIYLLGSAGVCSLLALLEAGNFAAGVLLSGTVGLGIACVYLVPRGPLATIASILAAFAATGLGVMKSLAGSRYQTWEPSASARLTRHT